MLLRAVNKVTAAQGQIMMVPGPQELPEAEILMSLEVRNSNVGIQ